MSFCFIFQVRKPLFIFLCSAIGAVSWGVYLLAEPLGSDAVRCFVATIVVSALAELLARLLKAPATIFLVIGIIPLVPGGGIYYAMEHAINGETDLFLDVLFHTLGLAGSLAVGVLLVSSTVRLINSYVYRRRKMKGA